VVEQVFEDGSVELTIPGLGKERVARGEWQVKAQNDFNEFRAFPQETDIKELEEQERKRLRDEAEKAMEAILKDASPEVDDSSSAASYWLSHKQQQGRRNHQVWLHVYDLDAVIAKLNDYALRPAGLGAFHCGVEILGSEWFFAWGDGEEAGSNDQGVIRIEPKTHQVHIYKESIDMGLSPLTEEEVTAAINSSMVSWPASSYHIVNRNCVHFAEDLLRRLKVPETFPVWVRGAADAGQSSLLKPMANWGWRWMQQYYTDQPRRASADDEHQSMSALSCCCAKPRKQHVEEIA
jgi:hypothetical protein